MEHMNFYILTATLDGIDLQPGDAIGIFDGNICVGVGVLSEILNGTNYLGIVASLNDPDSPETDGFTSGNTVSYRIWDSGSNTEAFYVDANYTSGVGFFTIGATATVNLSAVNPVPQAISLRSGWNILSFATQPDNMNLLNIVNPLITAGTLIKVQNESGNSIEQLPFPIGWINNIGNMQVTEGYKIRVSANTTLNVTGRPVGPSLEIPLRAGWNIFGYPFTSSQDALDALNQLITAGTLLKVQDEQGNSIEQLPFPIGWVDNIGELRPGEGYKIRTTINTSLTLNDSGGGSGKKGDKVDVLTTHFKPAYSGNGLDHMNLYILKPVIDGSALKSGDELGVFDGDLCVGAVVIDSRNRDLVVIKASLNDPTTAHNDGFTEGNKFEIRLWDSRTGEVFPGTGIVILKGYPDRFVKSGTTVINTNFQSLPETLPAVAFPNPSVNKTTFKFTLGGQSRVRLEIINSIGNTVKILVDKDLEEGTHLIEWDNRISNGNLALPGIYYYRLITNGYSFSRTLIIQN